MTLVHELGRRGEEIAADFLAKRGYRIINRRFRTRSGEIDLVCGRGEVVVLVEVKTRSHDCWGSPAEAVDRQKRGYLERAAREYRVLSG
ncbi:MAG: YraN family protein, partial [Candidatus Dormibacteraceae bacterium]